MALVTKKKKTYMAWVWFTTSPFCSLFYFLYFCDLHFGLYFFF